MSAVAAPPRRLPVGAEKLEDGSIHFRVWAPKCREVTVVASCASGEWKSIPLTAEADGYFSGSTLGLEPGLRYGMRLDDHSRIYPDPASRFQPDGPDGLSQLVDDSSFAWSDHHWHGLAPVGQVVYEMHIGTFTPQGTWAAAAEQLPELARCGMTVLEIMPVADFPGEFGWGYDGVCHFAPTRLYGTPDDFRRFVDRAHALGLGVILDVVYNHFGPSGNWLPQFSDYYTTKKYDNEWGDAINFDGEHAEGVRDFFKANARYWIEEFHLDGFRFDATQSIHDESQPHILTEIVAEARAAAGNRELLIVSENEPQNVQMVRTPEDGGHGMNSLWNDDFHHAATVRLTGRNEAYYSDYTGSAEEFVSISQFGFLYQGQRSQWQEAPRGTPTTGLPGTCFVSFLQNHDQVANSGTGARIHQLTSPGRLRAMTTLWLLLPQTPMFFQGQEFCSSNPFFYFADNQGELAGLVADGRAKFLSQFPSLDGPEARQRFRDPADRTTFQDCCLDFSDRMKNAPCYAMHADLLRLRREDPVFRRQSADQIRGCPLNSDCLLLRYFGGAGDDRLVIVNFGCDLHFSPAPQPLLAPPEGRRWTPLWDSSRFEYGGSGVAAAEADDGWHFAGESACVLRAIPGES